VANTPTATATSRATGSAAVHVRRPSRGSDGGFCSPVMSTVSRSGAETSILVSATGLVAVSPPAAANGSRAQPTPGSQASSGAPLAHHETPWSVPNRSKPSEPSDSVKSSSTSVDSPASSSPSRSTT
jgi:hypothetical protein